MDELPGVAALETHVSWLFFTPDLVFKVKKPVRLGFLDFSYPPSRWRACADEVRLNRRLCPDVYDGVARLALPDGSEETMVVMRRLPQARCLARLAVEDDAALVAELPRLVELIAAFHATADRSGDIDAAGTADWARHLWEHNVAELGPFRDALLDGAVLDEVDARARAFLSAREPLFDSRIRSRRVCDGHGDLLAEDIYLLPDGPRVLDCLEFDPKLRWGDVLADVAFLAMDLEHLGRPDLARDFLDGYRELTDDDWPPALAHHWLAYRALVRAKVAALRAVQGDPLSAGQAAELLRSSLDHLRAATVTLMLVGGAPGVGKSTVGAGLAGDIGAVLIRSDLVRKELLGLPADHHGSTRFGQGPYRRDVSDQVYEEMVTRAQRALELGYSVVIDATWAREAHRELAADAARRASAQLVQLRCDTTEEIAAARIRSRRSDASDATPAIARHLAETADPWPAATTVDTGATVGAAVSAAQRAVDAARAERPLAPAP